MYCGDRCARARVRIDWLSLGQSRRNVLSSRSCVPHDLPGDSLHALGVLEANLAAPARVEPRVEPPTLGGREGVVEPRLGSDLGELHGSIHSTNKINIVQVTAQIRP